MNVAPIRIRGARDAKRDTRLAWLSLLLYPVSFAAAFFVGEGLATWLFDWPDNADPALWQILVAVMPALVVFALPAIPAWYFGMRAHRNGSHSGRIAAWVAAGIAAGFVLLNALSALVG